MVAAAAALLFGMTVNYFSHFAGWKSADLTEPQMARALSAATEVTSLNTNFETANQGYKDQLTAVQTIGNNLRSNVEGRLLWLELLKTISDSLPQTDYSKLNLPPGVVPDHKAFPIQERKEIYIESIEVERFPELAEWWKDPLVQSAYAIEVAGMEEAAPPTAVPPPAGQVPPAEGQVPPVAGQVPPAAGQVPPAAGQVPPAAGPADPAAAPVAPPEAVVEDPGPSGPGWVVEIRAHHFYNAHRATEGAVHVRRNFISKLQNGTVKLPNSYGGERAMEMFTTKELGIGYVILAEADPINRYFEIANEDYVPEEDAGDLGFGQPRPEDVKVKDDKDNPPFFRVPKYSFTIQFVWQEKWLRQRLIERQQKKLAEDKAKQEAEAAATAGVPLPPATPGL
jgi:hypothetical protein